MVKVLVGEKEIYYDGYLFENLQVAKEIVAKDWDMVFAIDGTEGSGKSTLAQQLGAFCDPSLSLDRIVFNPTDFTKAVVNAEKYQAIIYDEAFTGMDASAAMSNINKSLKQMMAEIRQKNLFIFIVMPTFFDLQKYHAIWRTRALIHCYTGDNFQRGFFKFYNSETKKHLYIKGKKFYDYNVQRPNFYGRFVSGYYINEQEYRHKKLNALKGRDKQREEKVQEKVFQQSLFDKLRKTEGITNVKKAELLGISEGHYYRLLREAEDYEQT